MPQSQTRPADEFMDAEATAAPPAAILNLTQHPASPAQIAAGVVDLTGVELSDLKVALNFAAPPTALQIECSMETVTYLCGRHKAAAAMVGGAPWLMAFLERALRRAGVRPLYAFSQRPSPDRPFEHICFVDVTALERGLSPAWRDRG